MFRILSINFKLLAMRSFVFVTLMFFFSIQGICQYGVLGINFESEDVNNQFIEIDYGANPNNIWQIAVPNKPLFDAAHSPTHVMITDANEPYPVNDTSSFILKFERDEDDYNLGGANVLLSLSFWYKINSDTLTDYGKIEVSADDGLSWIDIMTEDEIYGFYWMEEKPVLSGNSRGWQYFSVDISELTYSVGFCDTLLYRFSFISDDVQTNKEGWIIDDFGLDDMYEGIEDFGNPDLITIYPNPAANEVMVSANNILLQSCEVLDFAGKSIFKQSMDMGRLQFDLPDGMYVLKFFDNRKVYIKKLLIVR